MPGYELIGSEEFDQVKSLFNHQTPVLCRQGFEARRNNIFYSERFESLFCQLLGCTHSLAVTSGSTALLLAIKALNLPSGSFIATQKFTFVATAEAIIEAGHIPLCLDIDDSLNLSPISLDLAFKSYPIAAVVVVHMLGYQARITELLSLCNARNVPLIEDTAWGNGASFSGNPLGTFGLLSSFSFDSAKAITTGEGGMVCTNSTQHYERVKALHDHGHDNNPSVPRWMDTRSSSGFNYRISELTSAIGIAQLPKLPFIISRQLEAASYLLENVNSKSVSFHPALQHQNSSYDGLILKCSDATTALDLKKKFEASNIGTKILPEAITWHYSSEWSHMPELINFDTISDTASGFDLKSCVCIGVSLADSFQQELHSIVQITNNL